LVKVIPATQADQFAIHDELAQKNPFSRAYPLHPTLDSDGFWLAQAGPY
jgi:hypothetical protein